MAYPYSLIWVYPSLCSEYTLLRQFERNIVLWKNFAWALHAPHWMTIEWINHILTDSICNKKHGDIFVNFLFSPWKRRKTNKKTFECAWISKKENETLQESWGGAQPGRKASAPAFPFNRQLKDNHWFLTYEDRCAIFIS